MFGLDPLAYLSAPADDELLLRAVIARAAALDGQRRRDEIEVSAKLIAHEISKLF